MSAQTTPSEPVKPASGTTFSKWLAKPSGVAVVVMLAIILVLLGYGLINQPSKSSTSSSSKSSSTKSVGGQKLALKEFGVQVTLPSTLSGATYKVSQLPGAPASAPVILDLELPAYTTLANKCMGTAADKDAYFASLVKSVGSTPSGMTNLKQFDEFYIGDLGGSVTTGTVCKNTSVQKSFHDLSTSLESALKSAFNSATKI